MIYAIDYDGTWTRDPALLAQLVAVATRCGTTCVMLTGRSDEPPWGDEVRQAVKGLDVPIVFAAGAWKRDALDAWLAEHGRAGEHCIVIDDNPEYFAPQDPRLIVGRRPFALPEAR